MSEFRKRSARHIIRHLLFSPYVAGTVTGSVALGIIPAPTFVLQCIQHFPESISGSRLATILSQDIASRICVFVVGFEAGFFVRKSVDWFRYWAIRKLLSYQEWIYGSKSWKNRIWGLLLTLLEGPGPFSTDEFQGCLPKHPVPDLDKTLDRWLEVSKVFSSESQQIVTEKVVNNFRINEGPKLQAYLKQRAAKTESWLSEYWRFAAYLSGRGSLMYMSNFNTTQTVPAYICSNQIVRAAGMLEDILSFAERLSQNRVEPLMIENIVPLCTAGYKYIFNSTRFPGEHVDSAISYFNNKCIPDVWYLVVIRNGMYFRLDVRASSDGKGGRKRLLTAEELKLQLTKICEEADGEKEEVLPVASLTVQERPIWAKQRERLSRHNKDILETIDRCLLILSLDSEQPKDKHEMLTLITTGSGNNRWFDKSFTLIIFPNGAAGYNCEHSVLDGMVFSSMNASVFVNERYSNGDIIRDPRKPPRLLPRPKRLNWNLEGLEEDISKAMVTFRQLADEVDYYALLCPYGKRFMKKCRLSPDGFIQMALQLAFYRKHGGTPKSYEPSTSMLYKLGRTETVHPNSHWSAAWVQSMDDPHRPDDEKKELLKKAIYSQNQFRLDATIGRGCDRHLLGLLCASRELSMQTPAIFEDDAWKTPFKITTSQTPNRFFDLCGDRVDFPGVIGGFSPHSPDGYGVLYVFHGDDILSVIVSSFRSCSTTDATAFAREVTRALEDMKTLYGGDATSNGAKK